MATEPQDLNDRARRVERAAPWVLVCAFALALLAKHCGGADGDALPAGLRASSDSLLASASAFHVLTDTTLRAIARDTAATRAALLRADASLRSANAARRASDSLAAHARSLDDSIARLAAGTDSVALDARRARDQGSRWRAAYEARTTEADSLRASLAATDSALARDRAARGALLALYVADTLRRARSEQLTAEFRAAMIKLERPCRVFGPIPCPTRTQTMIGTAAIVTGALLRASR